MSTKASVLLEESRPSRRAITRGAAWSVPVIAVAATAPAYAASCDSTTPTSMNLASRNGGDGTAVTFTSGVAGGMTVGTWNLRTDDQPAMPAGWLELENRPRGAGGASSPSTYQDITVTFSKAVRKLTFDIADIDTSGSVG